MIHIKPQNDRLHLILLTLKSIYVRSNELLRWVLENPVKRLSQTRAWYHVERRQTYIKPHELEAWYQGLRKIENETLRDYLLLVLLTGLRREEEAATLKWESVDLASKTFTVVKTNNNESHTLPLSDFLYDLLVSRYEKINDYVFPGTGAAGHIIELVNKWLM
ncbi:hypothetical protein Ltuc_1609 [Legionella tucsonensis]|uniref:Tyr recombinase domain-containing protein n=1 Tax=Legionella tucsonensis TaxID=40335 RepID=A0A0W0ZX90_9GAMM|nr:hypothetical protein Ltuc_1609 [Legionella tucsonensis]